MKLFIPALNYAKLMRMHQPIGFFLLLWPTLIALWLAAEGVPDLKTLIIFVFGVWVMRALGCVINDIFDRNFDGLVERTRARPLAAKNISVQGALILAGGLGAVAFCLALQLKFQTFLLSIPGLILAISYPLMKRFMPIPQAVLGMAFAWSVVMAFSEVNELSIGTTLLFLATLTWVFAYDTQYALVDRRDDADLPIHSSALFFGDKTLWAIRILQVCMVSLLFLLGQKLNLGQCYFLSLGLVVLLLMYQQFLIKDCDPKLCFQAFLNNHYVGAILFFGVFLNYCA